jgi:hypothetical protein
VVARPFRRRMYGDSILNSLTSAFFRLALLLLLLIDFYFFSNHCSEIIRCFTDNGSTNSKACLSISEIIKCNFLGYLGLLMMLL